MPGINLVINQFEQILSMATAKISSNGIFPTYIRLRDPIFSNWLRKNLDFVVFLKSCALGLIYSKVRIKNQVLYGSRDSSSEPITSVHWFVVNWSGRSCVQLCWLFIFGELSIWPSFFIQNKNAIINKWI